MDNINNRSKHQECCSSAFGSNTLLYINKEIITIDQLSLQFDSLNSIKTLGIEPDTCIMKECEILKLPKVYTQYTTDIIIEDSFAAECCFESSYVLCDSGYYPVNTLVEGDTIQVMHKNLETGEIVVDNRTISKIDRSRAAANTSRKADAYLILSEFENVFIPYISKENPNIINFINFKQ